MTHRIIAVLLIIVLFIISSVCISHAATPQDTLTQYIADLQKNPNDNTLREKIIKHVQGMKQKPAIPEEANRHFIMADTFQKKAKDNKGYELAIGEYKAALLIAPWWPAAYNNMGILLEQVGRYEEAISALKLYIATNPPDARAAQNKIYQIEATKKMAAQQSRPTSATSAEKPKADLDVSGRWRGGACAAYRYSEYRLDGDKLYTTTVYTDSLITDPNCEANRMYRGQRREGITLLRSGKNEFRWSTSVEEVKVEFIGDKAFWTSTVFCCSEQNDSRIQTRER